MAGREDTAHGGGYQTDYDYCADVSNRRAPIAPEKPRRKRAPRVEIDKTLAVGDVVQVRSGGPLMTISTINTTDPVESDDVGKQNAHCVWFEGNTLRREWFFADVLKKGK